MLACALAPLPAFAADVTSTFTASSGNWADGTKWSSNPAFPNNGGLTYDAVIGNAGTCTLNQNITIQKFTLSSGTLNGSNSLTANDMVTWSAGTMSGTGTTSAGGGLTLSTAGTKFIARTVTSTGSTTWTGGSLDGAGIFNNQLGASFDLQSDGYLRLATFNNNGTFSKSAGAGTTTFENPIFNNNNSLTWSAGNLQFKFGGAFTNAGTFELINDASITQNTTPYSSNFNNSGTFRKKTGTRTGSVGVGVVFNNTGTVEVQSGTLSLGGGGTHSGSFVLSGGTTLNFSGAGAVAQTLQNGSSISGAGSVGFGATGVATSVAGTYNITGATSVTGTVTFSGTISNIGTSLTIGSGAKAVFNTAAATSVPSLSLSGTLSGSGTVNLSGAFNWSAVSTQSGAGTTNANTGLTISGTGTRFLSRTLTNTGTATWTGGLIDGLGTFTNNTGATLSVLHDAGARLITFTNNGTLTKTSGTGTAVWENVTFSNNASMTWSSGNLQFKNGGTFNNGGTFDLQNDASFTQQISPFTTNFNNSGTFNKSAGAATAVFATLVPFNNTGTVDVQSGTLEIDKPNQHVGTTITGGSWKATNGTLLFPNGSNITTIGAGAGVTLSGASSVFARINTLTDNQGTFTVSGGRNFTTIGAVNNSGALVVGAGSILAINSRLGSSGGLDVSGTLRVIGNPLSASVFNGLTIAGGTGSWTGALDLMSNDLVYQSTAGTRATDFARIMNQLKTGANGAGGAWTGNGITSSTAAADTELLFGLGVLLNDAQSLEPSSPSGPLYTTFSGQSADVNSILVKFTYFGDADLTGMVDSTDYFLTDHGFSSHLSGWVNGDFDYSGVVDSTDYFLIDHAFNTQGPGLAPAMGSQIDGSVAVPEPGAWWIGLGLGRLAGRGRRGRRRQQISAAARGRNG